MLVVAGVLVVALEAAAELSETAEELPDGATGWLQDARTKAAANPKINLFFIVLLSFLGHICAQTCVNFAAFFVFVNQKLQITCRKKPFGSRLYPYINRFRFP